MIPHLKQCFGKEVITFPHILFSLPEEHMLFSARNVLYLVPTKPQIQCFPILLPQIGHMLEEKQRSGHMIKMMAVLLVPIIALFGMTVAGLVSSLRTFRDAGLTARALEDAMDVEAMVRQYNTINDVGKGAKLPCLPM